MIPYLCHSYEKLGSLPVVTQQVMRGDYHELVTREDYSTMPEVTVMVFHPDWLYCGQMVQNLPWMVKGLVQTRRGYFGVVC
jgi:23S rRNA A2030 N6-methylase RlmJ